MPTKTASVLAKVSVLATARVMSLPESQLLKDSTEKRLLAYQRFAVAESAAHNLPRPAAGQPIVACVIYGSECGVVHRPVPSHSWRGRCRPACRLTFPDIPPRQTCHTSTRRTLRTQYTVRTHHRNITKGASGNAGSITAGTRGESRRWGP